MVNKCKEMEQEYTVNNETRNLNPPYLLSNLDELNILADAMEKTWPPLHNPYNKLSSPPQRF